MNYFLMLVMLAICGGAYYEYTQQKEVILTDEQQISDLTDKITSLQAENKKLADDQTKIIQNLSDTQNKLSNLTERPQGGANATTAAPSADQGAPVTYPPLPGIPSANNLGTIITQDGRAFQNCQLLAVETDGITFNHTLGITKVLFPFLPADLQKRFGYDPQKAAALTEAEIKYQEEQRKAAAAAAAPAAN